MKDSNSSTGPIKVVFFKGSDKPISRQINEKQAVLFYFVIGTLVFFLLLFVTIILMILSDERAIERKYSDSMVEIERLRSKIIKLNNLINSRTLETQERSESSAEEESPKSQTTVSQRIVTPSESVTAVKTPDISIAEEKEQPSSTGLQNNDSSIQSTSLLAEIADFRGRKDSAKGVYTFSYWLINKSDEGVRLDGKAVLFLQAEERMVTHPWIPIKDGAPDIGTRGILFRIQFRKEMTGEIQLPSPDISFKQATVVITDLNGKEIDRKHFSLSGE